MQHRPIKNAKKRSTRLTLRHWASSNHGFNNAIFNVHFLCSCFSLVFNFDFFIFLVFFFDLFSEHLIELLSTIIICS